MNNFTLPNNAPQWLQSYTILLTLTGSHAYGTATQQSDKDYKGICIPPPQYFFGLDRFERYNSKSSNNQTKNTEDDVDIAILSLASFVSEAMKGIPNNIEILFTLPEHIIFSDTYGKEIISQKYDFLTKNIKYKMGGYANGEKKKLITSNHYSPNNRTDLINDYGFDTKSANHCVRLLLSAIQILKTGHYDVFHPQRELLLDIKTGKYTYDEVIKIIDELDNELNIVFDLSNLPEQPDYNKINKWLIKMQKEFIMEYM